MIFSTVEEFRQVIRTLLLLIFLGVKTYLSYKFDINFFVSESLLVRSLLSFNYKLGRFENP